MNYTHRVQHQTQHDRTARLPPIIVEVPRPSQASSDTKTKVIANLIVQGKAVLDENVNSNARVAVIGMNVGIDELLGPATNSCRWKVDCYQSSNPPATLGSNVSILLFTKFVDHKVVTRLAKGRLSHAFPLTKREIQQVLHAYGSSILEKHDKQEKGDSVDYFTKSTVPTIQSPPIAKELDLDVIDFFTQPVMEQEMSDYDKFTKAFLDEAKKDSEGLVGKRTLAKIRMECGVNGETRRLVKIGWLTPVVGVDGKGEQRKHVGRYKAGPKMLGNSQEEKFEPKEPGDRAKYLIGQKPALLAEQAQIENELAEKTAEFQAKIYGVKKKLERIATAERLLDQLEVLMGPTGD